MQIKDYFLFFRWKNLLMLILTQLLLKFVLFQNFDLNLTLHIAHFFLLTTATIFISIAGYIINDIHDVETDLINKPNKVYVGEKISLKKANNLFVFFNSVGLIIGFYLSIHINKPSFFTIFILTSLLLYRYAIALKKKLLVGNFIISILVFFSILLVAIFDIVPATNSYNIAQQKQVFNLVFIIGCFSFFLTFLREIVKDLEDIKGDLKINANTIPIAIGIKKTKNIVLTLSLLISFACCYFAFLLYETNSIASYFLFFTVATPLLYFTYKIRLSNTATEFHFLSSVLKVNMLAGILTILFL